MKNKIFSLIITIGMIIAMTIIFIIGLVLLSALADWAYFSIAGRIVLGIIVIISSIIILKI